jgi:hypothetical protein
LIALNANPSAAVATVPPNPKTIKFNRVMAFVFFAVLPFSLPCIEVL